MKARVTPFPFDNGAFTETGCKSKGATVDWERDCSDGESILTDCSSAKARIDWRLLSDHIREDVKSFVHHPIPQFLHAFN